MADICFLGACRHAREIHDPECLGGSSLRPCLCPKFVEVWESETTTSQQVTELLVEIRSLARACQDWIREGHADIALVSLKIVEDGLTSILAEHA